MQVFRKVQRGPKGSLLPVNKERLKAMSDRSGESHQRLLAILPNRSQDSPPSTDLGQRDSASLDQQSPTKSPSTTRKTRKTYHNMRRLVLDDISKMCPCLVKPCPDVNIGDDNEDDEDTQSSPTPKSRAEEGGIAVRPSSSLTARNSKRVMTRTIYQTTQALLLRVK